MDVLVVIIPIFVVFIVVAWHWLSSPSNSQEKSLDATPLTDEQSKDVYNNIEPLSDFDWKSTPPIQLRPFKPLYHLTMGIENMAFSDLLAMDWTYLERKRLRRSIMKDNPAATLQCNPVASKAVHELYDWMFNGYLPSRFPTIFKKMKGESKNTLLNTVDDDCIELTLLSSPIDALRVLGEQIDTDFLILIPQANPNPEGLPIYHLEAFVTCFPAGFSSLSKLGLPLAAIHAPVPGYAAKLERSMDRFFARLPVGKLAARANWSITTHDKLFVETGNHMHGDADEAEIAAEKSQLHIPDFRLRCERQTLFRLPKSQALVFAFKTYLSTLQEVKADGDGPALADAIEGLGKGNVPGMTVYKRQVIWGDEACRFLRAA